MMERNFRNTTGQHRFSSVSEDDLGSDQVTGKVSAIRNHGFPKRSLLHDDPVHTSSSDFVPHIITRMPDLTGYGHDMAPQSLSQSRPKHHRWASFAALRKKLPLHHWKYLTAIAVVVAILTWSLFKGAGSHHVAQSPLPDTLKTENASKDNATNRGSISQESNQMQFAGFNSGFPPIPTSSSAADQPVFFNGTTGSLGSQNQYVEEEIPPYPYSSNQVAVISPDMPARDLAPWERQPNNAQPNFAMADSTPMSPQYDFTGNAGLPMTATAGSALANNNVMANNVTNSAWPGNHPNGGHPNTGVHANVGHPQWNSNLPQFYSDMPGNTPYIVQQNSWHQESYQANAMSQNGQFQPASPQQGYYQQYPAGNDNAIAMNTTGIPSYPQGLRQGQFQGQWPPQNSGNANNDSVPQSPYPAYPPQYAAEYQNTMQNNTPFAPQQQQPFPSYNSMAVSSAPETTYR